MCVWMSASFTANGTGPGAAVVAFWYLQHAVDDILIRQRYMSLGSTTTRKNGRYTAQQSKLIICDANQSISYKYL